MCLRQIFGSPDTMQPHHTTCFIILIDVNPQCAITSLLSAVFRRHAWVPQQTPFLWTCSSRWWLAPQQPRQPVRWLPPPSTV